MQQLSLRLGFDFVDLYDRGGLARRDRAFLDALREAQPDLHDRLLEARGAPAALDAKAEAELLLAVAPHLEDFLAALFGVGAEMAALAERHHELAPLYRAKRL